MRLVLVCDTCGAVQDEVGAFDYQPRPALPPPSAGESPAPDSGSSPAAA